MQLLVTGHLAGFLEQVEFLGFLVGDRRQAALVAASWVFRFLISL